MRLKQIFVYSTLILFIPGCRPDTVEEKDKFGGTLVYSTPGDPTIIHPFLTFDSVSVHITPLIFNGLLSIKQNGFIVPDLAESYEIKQEGSEFDINLKRGIKFHDGKELTSRDVKFTYEKIKEVTKGNIILPPFIQSVVWINDIKLVDKYKIKIILKQPFAPFVYSLSIGILPEHIYKGKDNLNDNVYWYPTGTGPFKLTYLDNKKIIVERFDDYFKGKPYLEKIIWEIHSPVAIWAKLLRKEIDYSINVPLTLAKELKKVDFLKVHIALEPAFYMLFLNCEKPLFRDKNVRQALNYAINKEMMINKVLCEQGDVCLSPFLPTNWAYNYNLKSYKYDPLKSLELLKENGWILNKQDGFLYNKDRNFFEFKCVIFNEYPNVEKSSIFIQKELNKIGIKMEIKVVYTVDEFYRLTGSGEIDAFFCGLENAFEPDRVYSHFHSSKIGTTNLMNYRRGEIDRLLESGRKALNQEERKRIYYKFQAMLYDDPPGIFCFYKNTPIVMHKKIQNAYPDNFEIFREVEKWWIAKNGN